LGAGATVSSVSFLVSLFSAAKTHSLCFFEITCVLYVLSEAKDLLFFPKAILSISCHKANISFHYLQGMHLYSSTYPVAFVETTVAGAPVLDA